MTINHSTLTASRIESIEKKVIPLLKDGKRSLALKILQDEGLNSCVTTLNEGKKSIVDHNFICPATKTKLVTKCSLNTCKFHVENDLSNNCILAYCHQQDSESLSQEEISFMYKVPLRKVRDSLENSMTLIRLNALAADAEENPDIKRSFSFVPTSKVCCVCGSLTDENPFRLSKTPLAFCSKECAIDEQSVLLEWRFGVEVDVLLRWAFHRFKSATLLEKTLGITRTTLQRMSLQYFDKDLSFFFKDIGSSSSPVGSITTTDLSLGIVDLQRRFSNIKDSFSVYLQNSR